jgi:hypothetical protein
MADSLYLSLWFSRFDADDMLPQALTVIQQFPFSAQRPGIAYLALHPVSWNEPTILERRFEPAVSPEEAILIASDLLHGDYAYVFEAYWDLWTPSDDGRQWSLQPSAAKFFVHGRDFDEGAFEQLGHIQVDFGLDSQFLHEEVDLSPMVESHLRANVQKLVEFSGKIEKNTQASARLLWSESEDNLAQKLIARLQKVQ